MELIEEIRSVNELTSQAKVKELRERVGWLNLNDPKNKEVFEVSRQKLDY